MVGFRTTREEVQGIYNEVYQQKSLLGPYHMGQSRWRPLIRKYVLPLKSRHGRGGVLPGWKRMGGTTVSILWPSHKTKSHCWTQVRNEDPHYQPLNKAREAHWRALEATHLLEQDIERLSWAASRAKHAKCWHPYSHSCSRGGPKGCMLSLQGPIGPKKHVTFLDEEEEMSSGEDLLRELWGWVTGRGEVEESDLALHLPYGQSRSTSWKHQQPHGTPGIGKAHCWSHQSTIMRCGWNGRPARWIHPTGGSSWLSYLMWEIPKGGSKNLHFLWGSTSQMQDPQGPQRVYCAPCTKMCPEEYVPVRCCLLPALSKLSVETTMEDPGVCTGPSILGREGWSAHAWWTLPFGDVHTWIKVVYEKIHNLQWPWYFWGPNSWVTWSRSWDHPA